MPNQGQGPTREAAAQAPRASQLPTSVDLQRIAQMGGSEPSLPEHVPWWRQVLAGMAPSQLSPLIAYGPHGLEQIQRHRVWEQNLPRAVEAAKELSAEQARDVEAQRAEQARKDTLAENIRQHKETEQNRADRLAEIEWQHKLEGYNNAIANVQKRYGEPLDPIANPQPLAPGSTTQQLVNPYSGRVETYEIPSMEEALRRKNIAETEPTPDFIKQRTDFAASRFRSRVELNTIQ